MPFFVEQEVIHGELNPIGQPDTNEGADTTEAVKKLRDDFVRADDDPKKLADIAKAAEQAARAAAWVTATYGPNERLLLSTLRTLRATLPVKDRTDYHPAPAPPKLEYLAPVTTYNVTERRTQELLRRREERRQEWRRRLSPVAIVRRVLPAHA